MSALTGVKVIDAKDGNVEKISYKGEEYLPIDGKAAARAGDIARITQDYGSQRSGEYFVVKSIFGSGGYIEYDGNAIKNANAKRERFAIFRKVSELGAADTPPGYEEIPKSDVKCGDYVVFTDAADRPADVTAGEAYEILRVDSAGDPHFDDNDGCRQDTHDHRFRPQKYLRNTAALKPGDYAKVIDGTPFNRGDIVKIIEDDGTNLAPLKCTRASEEAADYWWKTRENLTPATDEEVAEARRPALQVGDYAEIVSKSSAMAGFHREDTVKITGLSAGKHTYELRNVSGHSGNEGYGNAEHLRKIPTVTHNGVTYREVTDRPAKEGEKIRIVKAESPSGAYENGDVFTVKEFIGGGVTMIGMRPSFITAEHHEYTVLEPLEKPKDITAHSPIDCCEKTPEKSVDDFEVGDKVRICVPENENTSRGRAGVSNDVTGTVRRIDRKAGVIFVKFPTYRNFTAEPQDIEKVADGPKQIAVRVTLPDGTTHNIEALDVTIEGSR